MIHGEKILTFTRSTVRAAVRGYFAPLFELSQPLAGAAHDVLSAARRFAPVQVVGVVAIGVLALALPLTTSSEVIRTSVGDYLRMTLEDGSEVALNTSTELRVRYTPNRRHIDLVYGEALFDVATDKARPFDVRTRDTVVRATGTKFSVRVKKGSARKEQPATLVVVAEGTVNLNPPSQQNYSAGTVAQVGEDGQVRSGAVSAEELSSRMAWTTGRVVFSDEAVSDVVTEINRYNNKKIVIADPDLGQLRMGGNFIATNPQAFLEHLKDVFPQLTYHVQVHAFQPDEFVIENANGP